MAKKQAYFAQAEKLYIESGYTRAQIAKALNLTEKTVGEWKKEGDWDNKRSYALKMKNSCNIELHKMLTGLTKKVNDQLADDSMPDAQTLYAINSLAATMLKLKTYEDTIIQEEAGKKDIQESSAEDLLTKVQDILGV